ncbi:MAG: LysR family transcriptional regulator [Bacteroidetes bacterium]|nr:LysR family transcriptional regulator [Bacteroidota bacterium]
MLSFKHVVFLEVAQARSFTKASQTLFISQPAISNHIRQLEEEYRTPLFERHGNSISLTAAGRVLLAGVLEAKAIMDRVRFEMGVSGEEALTGGELKLGASTTVALYIIPPVLSAFHQKYPSLKITLVNRNSDYILKALLGHEVDLGIIEGKNKSSKVHSALFMTDEVVPVCSAKSPIASREALTIKQLTKIPVALRESGSGTLAALSHALEAHKLKLSHLHSTVRLSGTEALKNFIKADECVGFLPLRSVEMELASGTLVRLQIKGLSIHRQFYFVQRHGDKNAELSMAFIKFAKRHYNLY